MATPCLLLLAAPLQVDSGAVPAGLKVDSHMIFLNTVGNVQAIDPGVVWEFDGPVVGVMSDNNGNLEAASSGLLGATGTAYPLAGFNNRGLENNDGYVVAGNTITVNMRVTEPGDWIRVVTASIPNLDHFKCYEAAGNDVVLTVDLQDQFEEELQVGVSEPKFFCNPVAKRHDGLVTNITDPMAHLTCYRIESLAGERDVRIVNQFGFQTLRVEASELLCVPSQKIDFEEEQDQD